MAGDGCKGEGKITMTIDAAVKEWKSKKRHMGCISAAKWFCKRVKGFYIEDLLRHTKKGEEFGHTVATDGVIRIDLSPYNDFPADDWDGVCRIHS